MYPPKRTQADLMTGIVRYWCQPCKSFKLRTDFNTHKRRGVVRLNSECKECEAGRNRRRTGRKHRDPTKAMLVARIGVLERRCKALAKKGTYGRGGR